MKTSAIHLFEIYAIYQVTKSFGELSEHSWHMNSVMAVKTCQNSKFLDFRNDIYWIEGRHPEPQELEVRT